jgi:hypothetical protein
MRKKFVQGFVSAESMKMVTTISAAYLVLDLMDMAQRMQMV